MTEVTFFMIVTPRDAVIADYAVRSYAKVKDVDFSLVVYSNYLLPEQKTYFFPRWEAFPFVDIARNPHHDADLSGINARVQSDSLEGPAIVEEPSSTTVIHAGDVLTVGEHGELVIRWS